MIKQLAIPYKIIYLFLYFIFGLIVFFKGSIYYPDSYAFLDMAINRSPVYAIFLKCLTSIFGDNFEAPLFILQYSFLVLAIHFLLKTIKKILNFSSLGVIGFQLVLLLNGIVWYASVNKILSEALAFPLLIVMFVFLFRGIVKMDFKHLFYGLLVFMLLQFTRGQFIAFIPVLFLILVWVIYKTKSYKKGLTLLVFVICIPIILSLVERVYNKVVHNEYKNYTMTYVHCITAPFYLSEAKNISVFSSKEEQEFFKRTFNKLEELKIRKAHAIEHNMDYYSFFEKNFTKICNVSIHEYNMDYYKQQGFNAFEQQYKVDEMTTKMFFPLLKVNFKLWVLHIYRSVRKGFSGAKGLALVVLIFISSLFFYLKKEDSRFLFLLLLTTFSIANALIIAMVVHSIDRYTFYFYWQSIVAFIIILDPSLKKYD